MNVKKLITVEIAYASSLVIPLSVCYEPSEWYRWLDLKHLIETEQGMPTDRYRFLVKIPRKPGVYEVRATFDRTTWIHVGSAHGKAGLYARINHLLNGTHSHARKILDSLIEAYQQRKGITLKDETAKQFLEIRWSTCDQPELLELLLHIRYKPQRYDEVLFPHGVQLQAIPTDYQQMLSAQGNEPIPDDELI